MPSESGTVFTVGHSTHSIEVFLALLARHGITAVADVRSVPASRFTPQFNQRPLHASLDRAGVRYVSLGRELGARPDDRSCYRDGQVQFERLSQRPAFAEGIQQLMTGRQTGRIAVLCTEQEPLDCHRTILVSEALARAGASVVHIHGDGRLEAHDDAIHRLMVTFGLDQPDLFRDESDRRAEALSRQERRIAYVDQAEPAAQAAGE